MQDRPTKTAKWERLLVAEQELNTFRLRVPGGWLILATVSTPPSSAMAFVADPDGTELDDLMK
jgi:hypothetical protein